MKSDNYTENLNNWLIPLLLIFLVISISIVVIFILPLEIIQTLTFEEKIKYCTEVNFELSDFSDVILQDANILSARFGNVQNLTAIQIKSAKNWEEAYYEKDLLDELELPLTQWVNTPIEY